MKKITFLLISIIWTVALQAQERERVPRLQTPVLSPISNISQQVGLTNIELSYSRPSAKGRAVFGALVPYDKIWRTGANASTQLTFTEDVKIAGNPLAAGTYALYSIPGKASWTMIIHKNTRMRSLAGNAYKQENDAFRFEVTPIENPLTVETFTIQFTDISSRSLMVALSWENTMVKFPIEVEVDAKVDAQIAKLLADPEKATHRNYFEAAQFYYANSKDLDKALEWINTGMEKSPENTRYGLLKAKIQYAKGDKKAAMKTINEAYEYAKARNNANYMEQTTLFKEHMEANG